MIKIHAGFYKNIRIKRVGIDSTKETASIVREAVFNMLFKIEGDVLDLFAGSGSYGITALSLGANKVTFVDHNNVAIKTIENNLAKTKAENYIVVKSNYQSFLKSNENKYNIIFLDPPFEFTNYQNLLEEVSKHTLNNSKIVLEIFNKTSVIEQFGNFKLTSNKKYGSKRIIIYTNN